ncbi:MAG TPA: cytochrome c, partial [Thermoleophilia bacterium]|nr:cytochrome c [Thermoleophilia bacterium]
DDGEPQAVTDSTDGAVMDTETTEGMGAVSGEEVFSQNCATCHGADGTGIDGPDLTALSLDQATVEETVRTGPGAMTAFEGQLSDEQIQAVADYVTSEFMQ